VNKSLRDEVVLLPCPFCGEAPDIDHEHAKVRCENCMATVEDYTPKKAAGVWNSRHPPADGVVVPVALLRQLRDYAFAYHQVLRSIRSSKPMVEMADVIAQADAILSAEGKA